MDNGVIEEVIEHQPSEVDDFHGSIVQIIQILKTDIQSPIFNRSSWPILKKLIPEGHCTIFRATLYLYLKGYKVKGQVTEH